MFKNMRGLIRGVLTLALVAVLGVGSTMATDPTITDVGNAGGYISAAITALGTLAGLVLGGYFAFWLVRKTFKWANRIG
jgi:hypothetical protein